MKFFLILLISLFLIENSFATAFDDIDEVFRSKEYVKIAKTAETECENNNNYKACFVLARLYSKGLGVKRNESKSLKLYKKSCDRGFHNACQEGQFSYDASVPSIDIVQYTSSCNKKEGEGCYRLAMENYKGNSIPQNKSRGIELMKDACNLSYSPACGFLANLYMDPRHPEIIDNICKNADQKDCAEAYEKMGHAYLVELNVPKDKALAIKYYQKACDGKSSQACFSLARMYQFGDMVPVDRNKVTELLNKACEERNVYACMWFGSKDSYEKAFNLLNESCENGNAMACVNLGEFYNTGRGFAKDPVKAKEYFDKACEMDDEEGLICKRYGRIKKD